MGINEDIGFIKLSEGASVAGVGAVVVLLLLSGIAMVIARGDPVLWKLLAISWVAFLAMAGSVPFGARAADDPHPRTLVWGYGLASGAMITSAALFLLPQAIGLDPKIGGIGVALGLLTGFGVHTIGHRLTHADLPFDHTAVEIAAHAFAAGTIIGLIYGTMPSLGPLLGLAIVSHKGPAGYAAARRFRRIDKPLAILLIPASGLGIMAIPVGLVGLPPIDPLDALVFGFAAGIFLHVAMDFLPSCEVGSDVYEVVSPGEHEHQLLDELRIHAVASTVVGGAAVVLAWLAIG
ncbi:MAG: ZIP family zinc transporter [Halobacteriales archaeon]|jgi:ZIP family zinc transporter